MAARNRSTVALVDSQGKYLEAVVDLVVAQWGEEVAADAVAEEAARAGEAMMDRLGLGSP
jgi:hypothetical protein